MTVRRIMGTEVEYGISVPGQPQANPMVTSSQVVNAYGARPELTKGGRARWDYEEESPLRDARGFTYTGAVFDPAEALADEDLGLANVILTNGARLYVDHAHPEYSTPEVTNPLDVVLWDKAGERVMAEGARRAGTIPGAPPIHLYKHNTDNKGASFGAHENYLMKRQTPFAEIVTYLTPFFVTRQVVCGAGRVGIGADGSQAGYQVSQRADFFEVEVGLETTLKRPIINTRDEPHADADKYRRLHVIIGDANLSEISTYLKVGTTALILTMIEEKALTPDLSIADPVAELRAVSHDPSLTHRVRLRDGRRLTALDVQWAYYERARAFMDSRGLDDQTADVLDRWEAVLDKLGRDPMLCADELDWVAKLRLLEGYRERENLGWASPKLHLVDLQYADVRQEKGLYHRLVARGAMKTLLREEDVRRAMTEPPEDTRAYFRGRCLAQYASEVVAASWDSVIFDVGRESLVRVPMLEPERGTKRVVGPLFDRCASAKDLLEALTAAS
ncbi:MAG: proteasome accessory factor PafA2 [Hamadaea sp.]|uniref:depupylase/deamidase Dop n=1 Tax=Hamadaea sp. NPDC050747 TaxID=3155789 RepID=UPI00179BA5C4|nr:proteasome accessory factor PafA2 [Hamadaea sp.]NUR47319.1 proteasome accessory factor PafA2 [Hamadaea sp.]NUR72837.1 proteasome accessory factor PafA2 [Hamadaea sp.]